MTEATYPRGEEESSGQEAYSGFLALLVGIGNPTLSRRRGRTRFPEAADGHGGGHGWTAGALALGAGVAPGLARATIAETSIQPMPEANWSATAGRTVGAGSSMLQAEAGWPGISFTSKRLKGLDEAAATSDSTSGSYYGFEGTTKSSRTESTRGPLPAQPGVG